MHCPEVSTKSDNMHGLPRIHSGPWTAGSKDEKVPADVHRPKENAGSPKTISSGRTPMLERLKARASLKDKRDRKPKYGGARQGW